jgi:Protein of unknown function (DUF3429)
MQEMPHRPLAQGLTYAGTLPLIACATAVWTGWPMGVDALFVAVAYGAVIASFLAGIHWAAYLFDAQRCKHNLHDRQQCHRAGRLGERLDRWLVGLRAAGAVLRGAVRPRCGIARAWRIADVVLPPASRCDHRGDRDADSDLHRGRSAGLMLWY